MAKFKKRPVIPIYAIALVWVIFTLVHPLYRVSDYVTVILLSAVVFIVAKGIFPTISYEMPDPQPQAAPSASEEEPPAQDAAQEAQEEAPSSTGDPKIDALIQEKDRALQEMRRLNDAIEDEIISRRIDQLEDTTGKIIDQVVAHPEKLSQIRTFMNYYLPTTLKILNAYDRMGAAGVSGENIDSTMQRIETMMDTIVMAFHKQLDALFRDDAMDIASGYHRHGKSAGPGGTRRRASGPRLRKDRFHGRRIHSRTHAESQLSPGWPGTGRRGPRPGGSKHPTGRGAFAGERPGRGQALPSPAESCGGLCQDH